MTVKYTDIYGLEIEETEENIRDLCKRLQGKSTLLANRGDMRMAASVIEALMEMLGCVDVEKEILEQIPF